jgi:hypothetical protein
MRGFVYVQFALDFVEQPLLFRIGGVDVFND